MSSVPAHRTWEAAAAAARASLSGDGDVDDVMPVRFGDA